MSGWATDLNGLKPQSAALMRAVLFFQSIGLEKLTLKIPVIDSDQGFFPASGRHIQK